MTCSSSTNRRKVHRGVTPDASDQPPNSTRWQAFPVLSALVSVLAFLTPIAVSIAAAATLARCDPQGRRGLVGGGVVG